MASILLLGAQHQQFHDCTLLYDLVLSTGEELQRALAPLHAGACPAQLTAQVGRRTLVYLLGLQLLQELHGCSCSVEGVWGK